MCTKSLKMFLREIQIPFGTLSQIINIGLARRCDREHVATDSNRLGFNAATTRHACDMRSGFVSESKI